MQIGYSASLNKTKQKSKNDGRDSAVVNSSPVILDFFNGSPFAKEQRESRMKGKGRKYPTENGYMSVNDVINITGFNYAKIFRLLKFKTMDEILKMGS